MIKSPRPFVGRSRSRRLFLTLTILVSLLPVLPFSAPAQTVAKRPINHNDYDSWRSIQAQQLSRDGKFLAYALVPEDGDGEVVVRNLASGSEWRQPTGHRPDPNAATDTGELPAAPAGGGRGAGGGGVVSFTADGHYLVFVIYPLKADTEKAKRAKKRPEEMPKNSMGIMDLSTGEVARVEKVRRFQVPEEGAGFIAYVLEPKVEERKPPADGAVTSPANPPAGGRRRPAANNNREFGSDLVLRNMSDKTERTFADALEFNLSRDAKTLVYTVASKKEDTNGVYAVATGSTDAPAALLSGKGKYSRLSWDEKQAQLAFLSDRDDAAAKQPKFKLYGWNRQGTTAEEWVSTTTPNFKRNYVISDKGAPTFSLDGSKLFFGVARPPEPEADVEDDTPADEKVSVDLWHWKDDYIQPMQKIRADQEKNRSYRAVFHVKEKKYTQLADETMAELNPTSGGQWAIGTDDRKYRTMVGYDTDYLDVYLVNTADGSRKPLLEKQQTGLSWSSNGKYALMYDGKDWNSISVPDGKIVNLTKKLGVSFANETHDSPSPAPSYGLAGWAKDDKYILINDRYDIWRVAPDGSSATNLTGGIGRKEKTQFRYVRLDQPDRGQERGIDPTKPLLLRAENEWTRDSGFYRVRFDGGSPEKLVMAAKNFTNPTKAKDADVLLLTASTFSEFPDLLVTGPDFKEFKKVSDANPQKAQLLWGTDELIRYKNVDGVPLSGILFKPANFDPAKKYPMIVYLYETLSENVNHFVDPAPRHTINASYYTSNGYLVLMPDIVYTIGYPGQSALKCVLPAVQSVVDMGFVNENAIGIQGHSWGGYQIAYMVTQTNRFKAAAPGAVVANMTSAYSGIRWGTGIARQFQYEHTQSRIGGNLWEYPMRFIENSPVFMADRVHTPLLMIHNDMDDAVPWYQGIEYYMALRRLGREVYMFSYNGEPHGLRRRPNQKDYTVRLQQFFDYYLKGAAMPDWMEHGVPFLEKGKEKDHQKAIAADKVTTAN